MKVIDENIAKAIRRKKADLMLNESETAGDIGISADTFRKVRKGNCSVKDVVYVKITQWLAKDY